MNKKVLVCGVIIGFSKRHGKPLELKTDKGDIVLVNKDFLYKNQRGGGEKIELTSLKGKKLEIEGEEYREKGFNFVVLMPDKVTIKASLMEKQQVFVPA